MAESIEEVLAERLRGSRLDRPLLHGLAALLKLVDRDQGSAQAANIATVTRRYRRLSSASWLWPCQWIPPIDAALSNPTTEGCAAIAEFFHAVAVIRHLLAGRPIKRESEALLDHGYPFTFVALAHIAGRSRSLTPPPRAWQASRISDVEARLAWQLWCIADIVHQELRDLFIENGIAKTCRHCDLLMVDMKRSYCSERCRRAYQNAKDYRRRRTETR